MLAVFGTPATVLADDVAPGLWEISLDASVDAAPDFTPGPVTVTQCFSKQDTSDPGKLLASVATPGAGDCAYTERAYAGAHFRFKMQCSGALQLRSSGDVSVSSTSIEGVMTTSSSVDGLAVEFRSVIHGRRLGDC
jgi:hypothetical protein